AFSLRGATVGTIVAGWVMPSEGRRATADTCPCCGETGGTFGGAVSPRIETVGTFVGAFSLRGATVGTIVAGWVMPSEGRRATADTCPCCGETGGTFGGAVSPRIETVGTFVGASSLRGATVGTSVDHKRLFWGNFSPTEVLGVSSNCLCHPTVVALVSSACR
ncbi:MAG: hypothetical protein ACTTI9_06160, partial [Schaalia odontolytica]